MKLWVKAKMAHLLAPNHGLVPGDINLGGELVVFYDITPRVSEHVRYSLNESQDIGRDEGTPVDFTYQPPFQRGNFANGCRAKMMLPSIRFT